MKSIHSVGVLMRRIFFAGSPGRGLLGLLAVVWGALPARGTLEFRGHLIDRGGNPPVDYFYLGTIEPQVNAVGNLPASGATIPQSAQVGWFDPTGVPVQGDARYQNALYNTGDFKLTGMYSTSPGHPRVKTIAAVHFTNGRADGVWIGPGVAGTKGSTGIDAALKVSTLDQRRLPKRGDPVELPSGAFTVSRTLFALHGARDWEFGLSYHSLVAESQNSGGAVGFGWWHPFEARIVLAGSNCLLQQVPGKSNLFVPKAGEPGAFVSSDPVMRRALLTSQPGGGWLLSSADQSCRVFNSDGRLVEDRDAHGRRLVIAYDGSFRIAQITEPVSGARLTFSYVFGTPRIATVTDSAGATVALGYDNASLLTQIVNQNGTQGRFTYDDHRRLLQVKDHFGTVLTSNTYDADSRVIAQDDGVPGNQPVRFEYLEEGLPGNNLYAASDADHLIPLPLADPEFHRLLSFRRLDGQTITYGYDEMGRLVSATLGGSVTRITYDADGRPISVIDPAGQETPVKPAITVTTTDRIGGRSVDVFDPDFNLRSNTDATGRTTTYEYDAEKNLVSVTDPAGAVTRFSYDAAGNPVTMTDVAGNVTTHRYDERNNLVETREPDGGRVLRAFDARNNLLSVTDPHGGVASWTYDANAQPLTATLPSGGVHRFEYANGRLVRRIDPTGAATAYGYDPAGRLVYQEDAFGKRTQFAYDAVGNTTTVTDALGHVTRFQYDHRNRLVSETDPTGATTAYVYDNNNNRVRTTDPLGKVTLFAYDGEDRRVGETNALGQACQLTRDPAGRLIAVTDALGNVTRLEYDAAGRLTTSIDPEGRPSRTDFDLRGWRQRWIDPLGRATAFAHDVMGRETSVTDPLGRRTEFSWSVGGLLKRVVDPAGLEGLADHDANGNRTSFTNPNGSTTTLEYDRSDRVTRLVTSEGRATEFVYDARGLLASTKQPSGARTTYSYDDAQHGLAATDAVGTITFGRDANGRLETVTENGRTFTRSYDAAGRMTAFTDVHGNTIRYAYDAVGRLTTLTYPDGRAVDYGYDAAGRLVSVRDWAGRVTSYAYDRAGRIVGLTRPNGTKLVQTYDAAGQLVRLLEQSPDGFTPLFSGEYEYDAGGQLTAERAFPAFEPLVANSQQNYDRDNRLVARDGVAVTFDPDGNLLSAGAGVSPSEFVYDARNRLVRAGDTGYEYDAEGRRVSVTTPAGITEEVVSPVRPFDQLLVRRSPDGRVTYYVYGLGLVYEERAGQAVYYHFDRRGNTVATSDAAGQVSARMSYGPYGEPGPSSGSVETPFRFSGKWGVLSDSNGLRSHRARYFHPGLRRFLNEDVILGDLRRPATLNRYAYTRGNPVSFVDPDGRYDRDVHYDLTKSLAIRVGFDAYEAETIAAADQLLDDDLMAGPFLNPFARRKYHFATEARREEMFRDAFEAGDYTKFGYYLHSEQDSFSHQDGAFERDGKPYGWFWGHLFDGHGPDQAQVRPELALKMAERTYQQLRVFYEQTNGKKSCDDWDNIEPIVEHWLAGGR